MKELMLFLGIMVLWIVLNRWVLPWFGVQTCMSGGCAKNNVSSCCAEPMSVNDKDVSQSKGE